MAFFGLRWVPKTDKETKPSEASTKEMVKLVEKIRTAAAESCKVKKYNADVAYYSLYNEYTTALSEYQQWEAYANSLLQQYPREANTIIAAAQLWKNGDSQYYDYLRANPIPSGAHTVIEQYATYLQTYECYSEKETKLWEQNYNSQNFEAAEQLWQFERNSATRQVKNLEEQEKRNKLRVAESVKQNAQRIAELRLQHHQQTLEGKLDTVGNLRTKQSTKKSHRRSSTAGTTSEVCSGAQVDAAHLLDTIPGVQKMDPVAVRRRSAAPSDRVAGAHLGLPANQDQRRHSHNNSSVQMNALDQILGNGSPQKHSTPSQRKSSHAGSSPKTKIKGISNSFI
eukprot:Lankesteria_metandrocarpae@DN3842_c1_g1_i1.p1